MNDFTKVKEYLTVNMCGHGFARSILAGGAITSAFTKQKIADFDLYFRCKADSDKLQLGRDAMEMPWADWHGISQAIPPAYSEFIARQFLAQRATA